MASFFWERFFQIFMNKKSQIGFRKNCKQTPPDRAHTREGFGSSLVAAFKAPLQTKLKSEVETWRIWRHTLHNYNTNRT